MLAPRIWFYNWYSCCEWLLLEFKVARSLVYWWWNYLWIYRIPFCIKILLLDFIFEINSIFIEAHNGLKTYHNFCNKITRTAFNYVMPKSITHMSEGHFNVVKKFENPYFSGTLDRDMLRILFHLINANLEFLFPLLIKAWCKALSAIWHYTLRFCVYRYILSYRVV